MLFAEFLDEVADWGGAHLPLLIGLLVALTILALVFFPRRKPDPGLDPTKLATASAPTNPLHEGKAANWDPPEQSYADRRGSARREGTWFASSSRRRCSARGPTRASCSTARRWAEAGAEERGRGRRLAPGRAMNAPDTVAFIAVIVRSCRQNGDHFEVGCEFEKTPPWNVLPFLDEPWLIQKSCEIRDEISKGRPRIIPVLLRISYSRSFSRRVSRCLSRGSRGSRCAERAFCAR